MFLNLETDYAIRIVACLAERGKITDAKTVSAQTGVTLRFTLKILRKLVSGGFVKSYKGASGGYTLSVKPEEITLLDVIESMCGRLEFSRCQSENIKCTNPSGVCKYRGAFDDAAEYARKTFSKITF